jgi:hypothetical protein
MGGKKNENRIVADVVLDEIQIKENAKHSRLQLFDGGSHHFLIALVTLVVVKGEWDINKLDATGGVGIKWRQMVEDNSRRAPNDGHVGDMDKYDRERLAIHTWKNIPCSRDAFHVQGSFEFQKSLPEKINIVNRMRR